MAFEKIGKLLDAEIQKTFTKTKSTDLEKKMDGLKLEKEIKPTPPKYIEP